MKLNTTTSIDCQAILKKRGLDRDKSAAKKLANLVAQKCDKRVPMQSGTLKDQKRIIDSGTGVGIQYTQPYAHYQYHGVAMGGRAPKHYTGKALKHNQAPMRGPKWDVRTMQADGSAITSDFAKTIGGKVK